MEDKSFNPFKMAQQQFDEIAEQLGLDEGTRDFIRNPRREYHFTIPVRMDDGSLKVFTGYRSQHNNFRGPYKGGIRYHPKVDLDEVQAKS